MLTARRALASRPTYAPPADTFPAAARIERDSLVAAASELTRLLERVENSPLPQSYRALGESRSLANDSRVRAMLDPLADVERERDELSAGGGVDPIFVALTARAMGIGRSIKTIAEARQNVIRDSLALLRPPPAISAPVVITVDTLGPLQRRDSLQAQRESARGTLDAARRANVVTERHLREARAQANVLAPPIAILGASLVVGLTIGFAIALMIEVGRPRVSDLQEAERVTGERVLAVVRPREIPPERARRKADLRLPPLIDPTSDAYRLLASHASVSGPTRAIVTVAGDVPLVTATIAANIAAVSANEMRSTLLIDADLEKQPVASVLRLPPASGVAGVLTGSIDLAAAAIQTQIGRDRWVDVVPSGTDQRGPISNREAETLRAAIVRSARHYELTVVVSPFEQANDVRVVPAVLVCAHSRSFTREHTPNSSRSTPRQWSADHWHRTLVGRRTEPRPAVDLRELVRRRTPGERREARRGGPLAACGRIRSSRRSEVTSSASSLGGHERRARYDVRYDHCWTSDERTDRPVVRDPDARVGFVRAPHGRGEMVGVVDARCVGGDATRPIDLVRDRY